MEHAKARGAKILAELMRLRHDLRRQGHGQSRHRGAERGHAAGAGGRQAVARRHRLPQRPRHGDDHQRRERDQRHQGACSASTPTSSPSPRPSRCTAIRLGAGGGIEAVACIKAMQENWVPPTHRPRRARSRVRPRLRAQRRPRQGRSPTRCRTPSPSAASTPCWCSARRRPDAVPARVDAPLARSVRLSRSLSARGLTPFPLPSSMGRRGRWRRQARRGRWWCAG